MNRVRVHPLESRTSTEDEFQWISEFVLCKWTFSPISVKGERSEVRGSSQLIHIKLKTKQLLWLLDPKLKSGTKPVALSPFSVCVCPSLLQTCEDDDDDAHSFVEKDENTPDLGSLIWTIQEAADSFKNVTSYLPHSRWILDLGPSPKEAWWNRRRGELQGPAEAPDVHRHPGGLLARWGGGPGLGLLPARHTELLSGPEEKTHERHRGSFRIQHRHTEPLLCGPGKLFRSLEL